MYQQQQQCSTTFIYSEIKNDTLILKLTNRVLAAYNNHTAKKIKQLLYL